MISSDILIFPWTYFEVSSSHPGYFSAILSVPFLWLKLCYEFYSYKRRNRNKHQVKLQNLPLLEMKTINKNKKQSSCQVIEISGFGFWSHKRRKRTRKKVIIKSPKIPVSNFISINQAKEQRTNVLSRHKNLPFWFWGQKRSKRTRNKGLIKSWKLAVLVFEAINRVR